MNEPCKYIRVVEPHKAHCENFGEMVDLGLYYECLRKPKNRKCRNCKWYRR